MGQSSLSVPEGYKETAHPELKNSRLNKTNMKLEMKVVPGLGFSNWRWNLSPLEPYHRHLFLPQKFVDPELQKSQSSGWCADKQNLPQSPSILARYEPYIYTLENEILTRKMKKMHFKEHELWKILKAGAFAIRDWEQVYKDITVCTLAPRNIVFNGDGQIKIVNRFSFIEPMQEVSTYAYTPPPLLGSKNQVSQETPVSLAIYALGVSLLDAVSLNQSQYSGMPTLQKKQILENSNIYPLQIKSTILGMTEQIPAKRISLWRIFENFKKYKRLSTQFDN